MFIYTCIYYKSNIELCTYVSKKFDLLEVQHKSFEKSGAS